MNKEKFTLFFIAILLLACNSTKQENSPSVKEPILQNVQMTEEIKVIHEDSIRDIRDGEMYPIMTIANQTWIVENIRFNTAGSIVHPENPSKFYGRLYNPSSIQNACPIGWHIPSDAEWDEVEIAHGMPESFIGKGGWRGKHAMDMRSANEWGGEDEGTNRLSFNILPSGYYTSGKMGLPEGYEGLGYAAAFWSSRENEIVTARFMFTEKKFVNKWSVHYNETGMALSCRCVKD